MVSKIDNELLKYKKYLFLIEVEKAAKNLGVIKPEVRFWDHYEDHFDRGERAHIHVESNIICIAEPELKIMSEEDIKTTATHEVSHTHHLGHEADFQEAHKDLEIGAWCPPPGNIGALPQGYKPTIKKEEKSVSIRYKCNYHICGKRGKTEECKHCGKYFCNEHIKPKEPIIGECPAFRDNEEEAHPCFEYSRYLEEVRKKEAKEYGAALERMFGHKKEKIEKVKKGRDSFSKEAYLESLRKLKEINKQEELEKRDKKEDISKKENKKGFFNQLKDKLKKKIKFID